jgi:DNA-binding LytR/AlgR family response regulator
MLKVAICDNDANELNKISDLVSIYENFTLFTYQNPQKLSQDISAGKVFDIFLLDIVMDNINGLELANQIREKDGQAVIIFLTSFDKYALSAYGVRASQYLLKPIDPELLYRELNIIQDNLEQRRQLLFPLKTSTGFMGIPFHKITHCRMENRRLVCALSDGQEAKTQTLRIPFIKSVHMLTNDMRFLQPHISFLVNLDYVSCIKEQDLVLADGTLIPIAQNSYSMVKNRYMEYVFGDKAYV